MHTVLPSDKKNIEEGKMINEARRHCPEGNFSVMNFLDPAFRNLRCLVKNTALRERTVKLKNV